MSTQQHDPAPMPERPALDRQQLSVLHLQVLGMQAQLSAIERTLANALSIPGREQIRQALPDASEPTPTRSVPPKAVSDAARRLVEQTRTPEEQHAATFMHGKNRGDRVDVPERSVAPDATAAAPSGHGGEETAG